LLTGNDIALINQLVIIYEKKNMRDEAIDIMLALVRNFEKTCQDKRFRARYYPTLIYNLTKYLQEAGRHEEAIPLCEKGIAVCANTFTFSKLPSLISNKACCLHDRGDWEGALHHARQAYYIFIALNNYLYAEDVKTYVQNNFKNSHSFPF